MWTVALLVPVPLWSDSQPSTGTIPGKREEKGGKRVENPRMQSHVGKRDF